MTNEIVKNCNVVYVEEMNFKALQKRAKNITINEKNGKINKKKLSQRWNCFEYNGQKIKVQRDIYSAYLIKNVNEDLCSIHLENCSKDFDKFLELPNREILRLQGLDNLSSVGI